MQSVVAPASVRDVAFGICRAHGLGALSVLRPVDEAGDTTFTDPIIALERAFGVGIDMDETWTGMTVPELIALVETKVSDLGRKALLPANDDMPMIDRAKLRARRARSGGVYLPPAELLPLLKPTRLRDSRTLRLVLKLIVVGGVFPGAAAGLVIGLGEIAYRWFGWGW